MLEVDHLFDGHDEEDRHNNGKHLGEIVGLLGHPPREFLRRSPHSWRLFDDNGKLPVLQVYCVSSVLDPDSGA